ncbi:hypothetical protein BCR43DRAFT_483605 [Syncephalastrum racemosum]|uniref:C2H2-type domain-containing protein n=1 Tax=Syncephalastrum racemosum TaxID=13706 RepID=A0A1X2HVI6_SYNRA|nr:hypothetical protein BCR43DRAFT_483605 [Syncephalastrum racemosum]
MDTPPLPFYVVDQQHQHVMNNCYYVDDTKSFLDLLFNEPAAHVSSCPRPLPPPPPVSISSQDSIPTPPSVYEEPLAYLSRTPSMSPQEQHRYQPAPSQMMPPSAMMDVFAYCPQPPPPPQQQQHHLQQQPSATPPSCHNPSRKRPERVYHCEECSKRFTRPYNLRSHMRTHTNERPYPCSHPGCSWRFARPHDLKRHELLHNGSKPHACPHCDRRFARRDALRRHWKVDPVCQKKHQN